MTVLGHTFWGFLALVLALGCAPTVTMVGKPAPVPVPNESLAADLERLSTSTCWRYDQRRYTDCLLPNDPLVQYLIEVERYRDYIDSLRGEGEAPAEDSQ